MTGHFVSYRGPIGRADRRFAAVLRLERLEERATPAVLTPLQIGHAYGFDQITFTNIRDGGTDPQEPGEPPKGNRADGRGTTIAIVDANNDPYILSDLQAFDRQYGLPDPPSFQKVSQTGSTTSLPANNSGWSEEIALDVEWAHAMAPGANILLVEANSSSLADLLVGVDYARNQPGVVVVSMSWGSSEFSGETASSYQKHFTTPAGHAGVAFVGASGDNGAPGIFPAISPNVLGVGGTTLNVDSAGNYVSETAWSGSGGGPSVYFSKPSYQTAYTGTKRGGPDVSYDANPSSGFSVYNTYAGGWEQIGGTSGGAPQWAALIAIADQGRLRLGLDSLDGPTQLLPAIYSMPARNFNDVVGGKNGSNGYTAVAGYDLATGLGTPRANAIVKFLAGYNDATSQVVGGGGDSGSGGGSGGRTSVRWTVIRWSPIATPGEGDNAISWDAPRAATWTVPQVLPGKATSERGDPSPLLRPAADAPWWTLRSSDGHRLPMALAAVTDDLAAPLSV